jgi:hypothetical protein
LDGRGMRGGERRKKRGGECKKINLVALCALNKK